MNLLIMAQWEAAKHVPEDNTYAIRIHSAHPGMPKVPGLVKSDKYVHIVNYTFDDIDPRYPREGYRMFTEDLAKLMLLDFERHREEVDTLLIDAGMGKRRGPTIGVAFNEIFGFGHDSRELIRNHTEFGVINTFIYSTLLKVAKEKKFM